MYSYGPSHMAEQKQDDQLELTYSSYVRIRDVALKTCQRQWTIGRSGERESGISVLAPRPDDDDLFSQTLQICHQNYWSTNNLSSCFLWKWSYLDSKFRNTPHKLVQFLQPLFIHPVGWGNRICWLQLCWGTIPPSTSVLGVTLNHLMVRLQS